MRLKKADLNKYMLVSTVVTIAFLLPIFVTVSFISPIFFKKKPRTDAMADVLQQ